VYSAFYRPILPLTLLISCFLIGNAQKIDAPPPPAANSQVTDLLPKSFGDFQAAGVAAPVKPELITELPPSTANEFGEVSAASRRFTSKDGQRFSLTIVTTANDSSAYSLLTNARRSLAQTGASEVGAEVGHGSFRLPSKVVFVKGPALVLASQETEGSGDQQPPLGIARSFAETLDKGEGELPVLIKHLPNWQKVRGEALYAVSLENLKAAFSNQPIFDAVSFEGGAQAVSAAYDQSRMVIVEFNTPQLATDNDGRIVAKLQELRSQGEAVPTMYRRVGNYSVFVFDAPSQETANALIDQVKYEQMVQWLGENPYLYERALREFTQTTLGVFVNVVKGSALALISCLTVGGLIGGLLFIRRRAQQRDAEAYSDSGGLLRLNLDDLTPETDPGKLLGSRK